MDSQIGSVFRETRNRRKIDLSEVETATRIRLRYLLAIENEEWDLLPGDVYARGFIRTYASFLGLDGERLADDYRRNVERGDRGPAAELAPIAASPSTGSSWHSWIASRSNWLVAAAVVLIAVLGIVAIPGGGGGGDTAHRSVHTGGRREGRQSPPSGARPSRHGVSVRLAASAEVWVCVLDARGRPLVDGQILEAGEEEGPFHSGSFTVSLGNGEVSMLIDGREADIPATSGPVGYSIDRSGALTDLGETERPTCT